MNVFIDANVFLGFYALSPGELEELRKLAALIDSEALKAQRRPPGKSDSLGDALNWEARLEEVARDEDIHIVTADGDFRSALGSWRINEALATDVPKLRAIRSLGTSTNFSETHSTVARLSDLAVFTPAQARPLVIDAHRKALDDNDVAILEREMHSPAPQTTSGDEDELPF
jgi:hypothetical protein